MTRGVPGIETAVLHLALGQKARMDSLPKGHPVRGLIEREVMELGIIKNRFEIERLKERIGGK